MCLQETHQSVNDAKKWKAEWDGESVWSHALHSNNAGVAILFKKYLNVEIINFDEDYDGRTLRVTVQIDGLKFQLITIYGPNPETVTESEEFFDDINQFALSDLPCILLGDFNMVFDLERDRAGGTPRPLHTYGKVALQAFLQQHQITDVWREKYPDKLKFTWQGHHIKDYGGNKITKIIRSWIDRIYIPEEWLLNVKTAAITPFSWSDHDIMAVDIYLPTPVKRGSGYWKFNVNLLQDQEFIDHITSFWAHWETTVNDYDDIRTWWDLAKINFKKIAITHSTKASNRRKWERENLTSLLDAEESKQDPDPDIIEDIRENIRKMDVKAATRVYITTHMKYIEEGEQPTRYFFSIQKHLEKKQCINTLQKVTEDGHIELLTEQADIRHETANFYEKLYTKEENLDLQLQEQLISNIQRKLTPQQRNTLEAKLSKKELFIAIHQTEKGKTPALDGLTYEFYQFFLATLEDKFHKMQDIILNTIGCLTDSQRRSVITLLFKKGDPEDLANWRPVSLNCTDYKIISKAIANRLKTVLGTVIHPDQTCGIPGRNIFENLYLVRDIIRYTNQLGIKGYIISVDQEKAFDRVDRQFLYKVLHKMDFGPNFIRWVKILYTDSEACVLVNGYLTRTFPTTRGARQGCALSMQLYDVFEEPVAEEIRSDEDIKGIPLPGTQLTALQNLYADDKNFFLLTLISLYRLFHHFDIFERATGARIKPSKTQGLCLGGARPFHEQDIPVEWRDDLGLLILGIYFFTDQLRTTNFNWTKIKINLTEFIQRTKNRKLSLKGKVINLNMVALAKLWYLSTVFPIPQWELQSTEELIFKYLWDIPEDSDKKGPVARKTIYMPRERGGLALLHPVHQSTALRFKFF